MSTISYNIQFVEDYASSQEQSYENLYTLVEGLNKEFDRTPSIWPIYGYILAKYGYRRHPVLGRLEFHNGIDIPAWVGAPVRASASGKIDAAFWAGGYGMTIIINHYNGFRTMYAHLSKYLVQPNDYVTKGQVVGLVGSTGLSTGPHLHYEIRYRNKSINPTYFLDLDIFHMRKTKHRVLYSRR